MLRIEFSLQCVKNIFFGFIEALDSKGILNTLRKITGNKGITSAVECADKTVFTFATLQMRAMVQ